MSSLLDSAEFKRICVRVLYTGWVRGVKRVKITTNHITCYEMILLNLYHVISYVKNVIYSHIKGVEPIESKEIIYNFIIFVRFCLRLCVCVRTSIDMRAMMIFNGFAFLVTATVQ